MAGGSAAMNLASVPDSWCRSIPAIDAWLADSKPGDQIVYNHASFMLDPELAKHMRKLEGRGEVCLNQRRASDGAIDYVATRNRVRVTTLPKQPSKPSAVELDPEMSALFLRLKACARGRERCPSDTVLGQPLGLSPHQVQWAMKKLKAAGLIRTRLVPTASDPKYRVVTIVATGLETALPAGELR